MPALGRRAKPETILLSINNKRYSVSELIRLFGRKNGRQRTMQEINDEILKKDYRIQLIDNNTNIITELDKNNLDVLTLPNYNKRSFKLNSFTQGKVNNRAPKDMFIVKTNEANQVLRIQRAETAEGDPAINYNIENISAEFTYIISDEISTRRKYFNIIPPNVKTANDVDNFLREKYAEFLNEFYIGNMNAYDADNIRVQVRNYKNNLLSYELAGERTKYYLYEQNKYQVNAAELFNYILIDTTANENCLINTLKFINSTLNNRKLKKEIEKIQDNFNNGIIPDISTLTEALEISKFNYKICHYISGNIQDNIKSRIINHKTYYSFIIYNNHIYYLHNTEYEKFISDNLTLSKNIFIFEDKETYFNKLDNLINNNVAVKVINCEVIERTAIISSYQYNNIIYVYNHDSEPSSIYNLCKLFNIEYSPFITKFNLLEKITSQKEYKKSYFLYNHSAREYNYSIIENEEELEHITTIDTNLCYMNILENLPKIPIIDSLTAKTGIYNNEEILDNYFYSIKLNTREDSSLFFKNDDIYSGLYLNHEYIKPIFNYYKLTGKIIITEYIEGKLIDNYYKDIIQTLKKYVIETEDKNNERFLIKDIINIAIGKFNKIPIATKSKTNNYKVVYTKTQDNDVYKDVELILNDNIKVVSNKKVEENYNLYNHKPLRILLLNFSQLNILKIIDSLGINLNDIMQINTDSVSFNDNSNASKLKLKLNDVKKIYNILKQEDEFKYITEDEYINNNFIQKNGYYRYNSYKYNINELISSKPIINDNINNDVSLSKTCKFKLNGYKVEPKTKIININKFEPNNISFINDTLKGSITTYNKYAGIGKTYFIKNKLIKDNNNYIVLTPQHSQLIEYKESNIKCNTIAHYTYNNIKPEEELIIIDEFYNSSKKDIRKILSWSILHNKQLILLGDIHQLKAVDNDKDSESINYEFIKSISNNGYYDHDDTDINYRNNYSFEIYKHIINNNFDMNNTEKIIKYINSKSDISKTDIKYICYRNATKNKCNKELLLKYGYTFNSSKIDGEFPVIAKMKTTLNNELIYKKQEYLLKANNNIYKLYLNDDKIYDISKSELFKNFEPAYCLTLNSIQGRTLNNYNFIFEDIYFLSSTCKYNISGALYVLLSRQKEQLYKCKLSLNEFINVVGLGKNTIKRAYIK